MLNSAATFGSMSKQTPIATTESVPPEVVEEEARALKGLYQQYVDRIAAKTGERPSQEKIGEEFEIGTQGMVWQYLNGKRSLGVVAAERFARGLGVPIESFSPRLASIVRRAALVTGNVAPPEPSKADLANAIVIVARALSGSDGAARERAKSLIAILSKPAVSDSEVERRMPVTKTRRPRSK